MQHPSMPVKQEARTDNMCHTITYIALSGGKLTHRHPLIQSDFLTHDVGNASRFRFLKSGSTDPKSISPPGRSAPMPFTPLKRFHRNCEVPACWKARGHVLLVEIERLELLKG